MAELKVGDVFVLQAGKQVLEKGVGIVTVEPDNKECVIVGLRGFGAGPEDDHFVPGLVLDVRPLLNSGEFDHQSPTYTVAVSGDFDSKYMQKDITVLRHMMMTFVREGGAGA